MRQAVHSLFAAVSGFIRKRRSPQIIASGAGLASLRLKMVAVLTEERDRSVISNLCWRNQWEVFFANTCQQGRLLSDDLKPQVMLIDRDATTSDWRTAVLDLSTASSGACIMLVSKVIDDYLWNEVVCYGGYEVLAKPVREEEVSRAVRLAWSYWSSAAKFSAMAKR
jgi:hypothetical protein